jgi:hypothetical protein
MTDADFLLRLLRIAAEDDGLDPDGLEFAVITGGRTVVPGNPNGPQAGQLVTLDKPTFWPFEQGEILVLPKDGYREPFGHGRSTAKYDVSDERFGHDYAAASRRSAEVKAAPARDAFA